MALHAHYKVDTMNPATLEYWELRDMGRPRGSRNKRPNEELSTQLDGDFDLGSGGRDFASDENDDIPYPEDFLHAVDCTDPASCECKPEE